MRELNEAGSDPASIAMDEPLVQAIADKASADDLMEKGGALRNILLKAFDEAKTALSELVYLKTQDEAVRELQWKVTRYHDLVQWTRDIVIEGYEASQEIDDGALESILNIVRGEDNDYEF